jgi:Flp pilus assembly protein TadG
MKTYERLLGPIRGKDSRHNRGPLALFKRAGLSRRRGNFSVLFALVLLILVGFMAFTVDVGHWWLAREQLQNAADSAALAAVRSLDGLNNNNEFNTATNEAITFSGYESSDRTPVSITSGDVQLGTWDFTAPKATAFQAGTAYPYKVNAVQVTTHRTAAGGNPVLNSFGAVLGTLTTDVKAVAVAVGGSPTMPCGFPIAVYDCSILDSGGNLKCNTTMQFASGQMQNAGFTLLDNTNPTTPAMNCYIAGALHQPCPKNCGNVPASVCANPQCDPTSQGQIYVSNGNNLSDPAVNIINAAIAQAGGGIDVELPVLGSGQPPGNCGNSQYNKLQTVVGYVQIKITGATSQPNRSITASIDCSTQPSSPTSPNGYFFGTKSTNVYLVQ